MATATLVRQGKTITRQARPVDKNHEEIRLKLVWERFLTNKDPKAKAELAQKYLPLVNYIVGKISMGLPSHVESSDLESIGVLGMLKALDRFDPSKDVKFETYASYRIKGAIFDYLRKQDFLSRPLRKKAISLEEASEKIRQRTHRVPTVDELAEEMKVDKDEVYQIMWKSSSSYVIPLDKENSVQDEEGATPLGDTISDLNRNPEEEFAHKDLETELTAAIEELPEKQKLTLALYYFEDKTLKEIGEVLGVSESRVCQLHSEAVYRLRQRIQLPN
jgi:RNA polymerase sigma factor for flagellar operon FliA